MPERRRAPAPTSPLVASAQTVQAAAGTSTANTIFQYDSWQSEGWDHWRNLGEFNYGVGWLAAALSRVRLTAAELVPGGDEPAVLTEGPAADLIEQFAGGVPGQAGIMKSFGTHIAVPGECWLVAERPDERIPLHLADWSVKSTDAIRPNRGRGGGYEIRVDDNAWRPLSPESLPVRVWNPDEQYPWRAFSSAQPALPIMRRIDLLDRRIVAIIVSRLAMNGLMLIPQEGTFTVPEQYKDAADPFVQMLMDIASNNIRNPGSASAAIPIPVRFASEFIEKWRHLTFGGGITEELLDERDKELRRLATTLNMPAEILTGMGEVNHWGAWQLEESAIKLHIAPPAETIAHALTVGYLQPLLLAAGQELVGPNGGKVVVWYDVSELTARPDKSQGTREAYDRLEASGAALRRETGLDESDKPTEDELREQALKKLVGTVQLAAGALAELTGKPIQAPTPGDSPGPDGGVSGPASPDEPSPGVGQQPSTRDEPPPAPNGDRAAARTLLGRAPAVTIPVRVPVAAGLRSPPAVNGNGTRSRDGPRQPQRG